jgi:hypothetical protein
MNVISLAPTTSEAAPQRVEFFRLPPPGKRDPHFGLSRGWYYKAAALGEIRMVSIRQRNALRGVRLVVHDSVIDYIRRSGLPSKKSDGYRSPEARGRDAYDQETPSLRGEAVRPHCGESV